MPTVTPALATVSYANIEWQEGVLFNHDYGDVYCSRDGAVAESRHVYLQGNQLPVRWQTHFDRHRHFIVVEAGFGTGLNFLLTADAFFHQANSSQTLWYYAIEKSPLHPGVLRDVLADFPEFSALAAQLIKQYPLRFRGWHHLRFEHVNLILIFDDVADALAQLRASNVRVDAWFLDGFSPAVNADMWQDSILFSVGKLSRAGATASTYSAAGHVRRGLEHAGFRVQKCAGFGHKREMTCAQLITQRPIREYFALADKTVVNIVGAGIAGCALAHELASAGIAVRVHETHAIGGVLADHPAAIACPRWTRNHSLDTQWQLQGLLRLRELLQKDSFADALLYEGLLEHNDFTAEDYQRLGLLPDFVCAQADAWMQPLAFTVKPAKLCTQLLTHAGIELIPKKYKPETAHIAVYCDGSAARERLPQLPLISIRGQLTLLSTDTSCWAATPVTRDEQYRVVLNRQNLLIGATFTRDSDDTTVLEADHIDNIKRLQSRYPQAASLNIDIAAGFAGLRLSTRDHNPVCDRVGNNEWCNIGHGSHGLMTAFGAAAKLRSLMLGQPDSLANSLLRKTAIARFMT